MQAGTLHDRGDGVARVDQGFFLGVVELVLDTQEHVIRRVVGQHVENEAFFDGLSHGVGIESSPVAIFILLSKQAQGLGLWSSGERDEGDVAGGGDGRVLGCASTQRPPAHPRPRPRASEHGGCEEPHRYHPRPRAPRPPPHPHACAPARADPAGALGFSTRHSLRASPQRPWPSQ